MPPAGNENAGPSGGANSSELLPTPGMGGHGTEATPVGPGNMRNRVSSYLPTPVSVTLPGWLLSWLAGCRSSLHPACMHSTLVSCPTCGRLLEVVFC